MTREWDIASYRRKFVNTWAYCRSTKLEPGWRYITEICEDGAVWVSDGVLGYISSEEHFMHGGDLVADELVFEYKSVPPGLYWDKHGQKPFLLTKIHQRQYEVGIGNAGYMGYTLDLGNGTLRPILRWATLVTPDFDGPCPHIRADDLEVFNSQLFRLKKDLYCFKEIVGFMEDGMCFLRNLKFTPLVKPYLGEKWQIESL